jgi:hypothetical protein
MARNQEKAQSMLNRWRLLKKDESMRANASFKFESDRLPKKPAEASNVTECERVRMSLLRHLSHRVAEIQNGTSNFRNSMI